MGIGGLGASSLTMLWGISDAGSMKPLDSIDLSQHVAVPRGICARAHALAGDASSYKLTKAKARISDFRAVGAGTTCPA